MGREGSRSTFVVGRHATIVVPGINDHLRKNATRFNTRQVIT